MKYILTLFLLSTVSWAYTQTALQISGYIVNEDFEGLDLCSVIIFTKLDSSFVKSGFTDQNGKFQIANVEAGDYFIQVKQFGYLDYSKHIELKGTIVIDTIKLNVNANLLNQVTVKSTVPFIVRKIDRVVITPDALIANAGSNTLEVLERAPGVSVDQNGTILLKGRSGVVVFINDKRSYLSGTELENYLRTLPAGAIKNIEIMENPPAKYEAAGNAGIININIKRGAMKGFYGNTSVSYRRSRYNGSNNSLNLNYSKKKISVYTNLYGGFWENFQDLNINRLSCPEIAIQLNYSCNG